jgi:2'-5' RNA ligase
MLKIVLGSSDITDPMDATKALSKYTGSDLQISLNERHYSITFIRSSATGSTFDDSIKIELLWSDMSVDAAKELYSFLRYSINKKLRVQIGREEFFGVLNDTTVISTTDVYFTEIFYHNFFLNFSNIQSTITKSPILAKKHTSSIIEAQIPKNIFENIVFRMLEDDVYRGDSPHVTLLFLPDLKDDDVLEGIKGIIRSECAKHTVFQVNITGGSQFSTDKDVDPYFARVNSTELETLREDLITAITTQYPDSLDLESFPNYVPHITVSYAEAATPIPIIKPISFMLKELTLSFKGTQKFSFPFTKTTKLHKIR